MLCIFPHLAFFTQQHIFKRYLLWDSSCDSLCKFYFSFSSTVLDAYSFSSLTKHLCSFLFLFIEATVTVLLQ